MSCRGGLQGFFSRDAAESSCIDGHDQKKHCDGVQPAVSPITRQLARLGGFHS